MKRTSLLCLAVLLASASASVASPGPAPATGAPVDFTFLGIDAKKSVIRYRIKVNADKPIDQVDLAVKYVGKDGSVIMESALVWQNIVKSARQPIAKGGVYEAEDLLLPDTAKVDCKLKGVVFKDGTRWNAP